MRSIFGLLGLVIVLAVVGVLSKKQLGTVPITAPGLSNPVPGTTPQQQSQQIQKQIGQAVENSLQQTRPMPDDK
jgi:hypothetical protein